MVNHSSKNLAVYAARFLKCVYFVSICIKGLTIAFKNLPFTEATIQRCSVKKLFLKFRKIHKKTPVPVSFLTLICIKWVPGDLSTLFLATSFT